MLYWWSMIFSENRYPLFGIMLYWWSMIFSESRHPPIARRKTRVTALMIKSGGRLFRDHALMKWQARVQARPAIGRLGPAASEERRMRRI
jgi:hypothetical protein